MFPRNITPSIREALTDSPVLFLRGARQVGKSTLVRTLLSDTQPAKYVTLDYATTLALASADPTAFIAGLPRPVVIDEVQRVPQLLLAINEAVDTDRAPGQFLLTGSADLLTLPLVSDSLAGRMDIQTLWPLAQAELHGHGSDFVQALFQNEFGGHALDEAFDLPLLLATGGYPEAVARATQKRRSAWFDAYLTSIIERDIRDLARIQDVSVMLRLTRLLATRTGTLLNQVEVSRTLQVANATLGRYMDLLARIFLIHCLPAWVPNLGKRLVKTPKVYMVDCGLAAHCMGVDQSRLADRPELAGQLLETFVVNEILKHLTWSEVRATAYHFRTHAGLEVDLVLERPSGEIACVEIKHAAQVGPKQFQGLRALKADVGDRFRAGVVLYGGKEVVPFGEDMWAVPVSVLWR